MKFEEDAPRGFAGWKFSARGPAGELPEEIRVVSFLR
jgi:hypothetical protein